MPLVSKFFENEVNYVLIFWKPRTDFK